MNQTGMVNLYTLQSNQLIVENLKVLKLSSEDKPSFSALVPTTLASDFQIIVAQTKVKAALCSLNNQDLKIRRPSMGRQITKIEIEENL